ncbi:hypothetical protein [Bacteroides sp. An269]|uniref:hypothetical protein n=1 Tax=Bacteroides sp. An269 TaxID=1965613 RepID=UPI000B383C9F|nr:hypothetical protein [Bacteroides sp. An269]MBS6468579.1 hypothetical protein [Bacteroides sp.]OUO80454.1 hypothetical protein B5F71_06835 [Bacteroides sp. An269]
MRKVAYQNRNILKTYMQIFQPTLTKMQTSWESLRKTNVELQQFPANIQDILIGNFHQLVQWYNLFMNWSLSIREKLNSSLETLFNYDDWSQEIAEFFKDPQNGFSISSCHYCDMAYINVFEIDPDADAIYFLNTASDEELKAKLKVKSDNTIEKIKQARIFHSKNDFKALKTRFAPDKYEKTFKPNYKYRHHFDLDHVLPKSNCRLVSLSLFNFVPSCQICNQKLKKTKVLRDLSGAPCEKLSPTSPNFDFDSNAEFHIIPKQGTNPGRIRPVLHPQDFELKILCKDPDYENFVNLFKLKERYQSHIKIALHWMEMKIDYTDAHIQMMANSLQHFGYSFEKIKCDIFQKDLYDNGEMSFTKLRNDMLK